jgi:hypothetical protein
MLAFIVSFHGQVGILVTHYSFMFYKGGASKADHDKLSLTTI